jgi:hypothetical protein
VQRRRLPEQPLLGLAAAMKRIALKIDVDSYRGTLKSACRR